MANQSLYRRYRPRRFSELKGQDHVVKALRTSVAEGREGQAYLFSGPRGTGKTTTARILAKVLNCENPIDGEPCCVCESCLSVERGVSYDVHELDAASNNKVDDIRSLIERASLGTPGRHKVYILDEVHMLTPSAEAALLKTLEEPPAHVVFVLATTDPQKVADTIRSRTQHLQFHLIGTDTLSEHVRWVAADAGLEVSDAAIEQVLRQGAGSARDALSALELLASTGDEGIDTVPLDEFLEAMIDREPGRALTMVAHSISIGRDPRTLTEELIGFMRDEFLCLMAPELVQVSGQHIDTITAQASRLGAAGLVRGIEVLGAALTDMRHAPDPRVLLDVAAVQLTSDSVAPDLPALMARLHRLEQLSAGAPQAAAPRTASASPASAPPLDVPEVAPATSARAALGGRARAGAEVPVAVPPSPAESSPASVAAAPASSITTDQWEQTIRPALRGMTRAVFAPASLLTSTDTSVTLSLPNAVHREKCEQQREALQAVICSITGAAVLVELVVQGEGPASTSAASTSTNPAENVGSVSALADAPISAASTSIPPPIDAPMSDEDVDLDDLVDAPPESAKSPIDRLAEAFPGSELIDERS